MIEISENKQGKRFADALLIQNGASNPSGIARSLVAACQECLASGDRQTSDPAIRLIVHQLAYLCGVDEINHGDTYRKLMNECADRSIATMGPE